MNTEKIKAVFKAFKWIATATSVLIAVFFAIACVVFIPMIFLNANLTVEAGGLLGFFFDVLRDGAAPVTSRDLVLLVLPRFATLLLMFSLSVKARVFFRRGENEGALFFGGSKPLIVSMAVTSFLLAALPAVLTNTAKSTVTSPELFNITQTDQSGWVFLAAMLLFLSFFASKGKSEKAETPDCTSEEQI